ncbi:MMS19 nucleotide excision repair protein homolog, partial [Actinia tenebrosa]|uniref:MMS19 nucleotide excision repair protein n=1 Tax=Actinia tenebrosa TaxID=6105 RepID=A0A6P8HD23_ACTTE
MASEQESVVELYMKNQEKQTNSCLTAIVKDVYERRKNLLEIVEDLGSYLTSTDVEIRSRAVQLLSEILQRLVNFKLTAQEVELLANFYRDRLKDHYSIVPYALLGLQALALNQNLSGPLFVKAIQTVFTEVHVQSLMQSGRNTVYNMLMLCLDRNLKDLQQLGSDFVFSFIQAMDGEKDPRNLVLAFQLAKKIIFNFPISLFAEDLFEVTSCYFPIDFTPSSDDPYGITRDDLVLGLRKCLAATSLFAPFCLPLLLEKLESDVISAKIDSLLTLSSCMEVYTVQQIKEYLQPFWQAIKKEVYQTVSSDLE